MDCSAVVVDYFVFVVDYFVVDYFFADCFVVAAETMTTVVNSVEYLQNWSYFDTADFERICFGKVDYYSWF